MTSEEGLVWVWVGVGRGVGLKGWASGIWKFF